jgi:hypothetical protein
MICSKRILTIFFIFALVMSNSKLMGQVVIREKVIIKPVPNSDNNLSMEIEYNPLKFSIGGPRGFVYTLSGPEGSISGSGTHADSMTAINGQYTITISSLCECNTNVGWLVTWLDPAGNNQWVAGFEMWFGGQVSKSYTFSFNGIPPEPPTEPCDFDFNLDKSEICDTSQLVSMQMYLLSNQNCVTDPDITLSIQSGSVDLEIFNENNNQSCGTTCTFNSADLDQYKLKLNSRFYGSMAEEAVVSISVGDITRKDTLTILPIDNPLHYFMEVDPPNPANIVYGSTTGIYAYTRVELCGGVYEPLPDDIKYSAKIIKGMNYGTLLYAEDSEVQGDILNNLSHNKGLLRLGFSADGDTIEESDTIIVRISTTDTEIEPQEVTLIIGLGSSLVIDFLPPTIRVWESSSILIRERKSDGQILGFPPDQLFNFRITEGTEYASLYSLINDTESYEQQNICQQDLLLFSYDIPGDTARVKIYAETIVDDNSGGGGDTSIKEKKVTKSLKKTDNNKSVNGQIKLSGFGEILIVKTGARLNVSFDKNPIAPGESAKILIEGINDEEVPFNFSPDQTFYLSLGDGTKYGELFSTSTGQIGDFIENAPKEFIFNAKDSIDIDSAYVDVYVMAEYESGDGLGKANASVNNRKMNHASRIAEKFKAVNGSKEKSLLNKSIGKTSSTSEDNSVDEIFYLYGMARLLITKDNNAKLEIITPVADSIFYISNAPEMPTKIIQAEFSRMGLPIPITTAEWGCIVNYNFPPGNDETTYSKEAFFNSNDITEWELDFNNSDPIIGGEATIWVIKTFNGVSYYDSKVFHIRGRNPKRADIEEQTDYGQFTMLETESNVRQFRTENYSVPNEGLPIRGDDHHGWGISQLDDRSHTITTARLWDWTANLEAGLDYYNQQRNSAEGRLNDDIILHGPKAGQTRQSMIDIEGYAKYNGGPSARVWRWIPPDPDENIPGHWIREVSRLYDDDDDGIYETRRYSADIDENVGHYENNYNN